MKENLINKIQTGELIPNRTMDVSALIENNSLKIFVRDTNLENRMEEIALFLWISDQKKALYARSIEISNGCIEMKIDDSVMLQMQFLKLFYARVAIAYEVDGELDCRYLCNKEIKEIELSEEKRTIGAINSFENDAFLAYWTDAGLLSVRFRKLSDVKEMLDTVYLEKCTLEDSILTIDVAMPMIIDEYSLSMISMSTGERLYAPTVFEKKTEENYKQIYTGKIDLSSVTNIEDDAYRFIVSGQENQFEIQVIEDLKDQSVKKIILQDGNTKDVLPLRESNGLFSIQVNAQIFNYMLSIVTAVYNTKPFLAEMIDSVLKQQELDKLDKYIVGNATTEYSKRCFLDCFEFLLVDDGSTDGSADILDDYALIDRRVRILHKENGGVSSARNVGIDFSSGKYINFVDSDDILDGIFISECLKFYMEHDDIVMATVPLYFFEALSGEHWTNYKFSKKCEVKDLRFNPNIIVTSVVISVFRNDKKDYFNEDYSIGEDIDYIYSKILRKGTKVGLIGTTKYMYRRRSRGEESAIQQSKNSPASYTFFVKNILRNLLETNLDNFGRVPFYVQYCVMGQLQWKFAVDDRGELALNVLGKEGFEEYKNEIIDQLKYIDDKVIMDQRKIWDEHRYYIFSKKYGKEADIVFDGDDAYYCFGSTRLNCSVGKSYIRFENLEIENGILYLEGYGMELNPSNQLQIRVNNEIISYKPTKHDISKYTMDDVCYHAKTFYAEIPLPMKQEELNIEFYSVIGDKIIQKRNFRYAKTMPLAAKYKASFYTKDGWTARMEGRCLKIRKTVGLLEHIDYEAEFEKEVLGTVASETVSKMIELRKMAINHFMNNSGKKKIWLISDRVNVAGDNGEAMFNYLAQKDDSEIEAYFVINKDCEDYERLCKIGKVVPRLSKQHLLLQLVADYIVSSGGDEYIINPWYESDECSEVVRDLLARKKYVFLQHGVIMNDLSVWLNRYSKNIKGFVCAARREAESILQGKYYYDDRNVWLTGLPRHDLLYREERKLIVIMPTWRKYLSSGDGTVNYLKDDFRNTEYFKFYNELVNNERLIEYAEERGYKIAFMPHPGIRRHGLKYFTRDSRVQFFDFSVAYKDVFAWANLIVTDYSSAVMDFALLKKPVVYCQFDKERFFTDHTVKPGYFSYENDGFGEVTYDLDSLINVIIEYIRDDCNVHEPYLSRMNEFFAFHDKENCDRVYQRIKEL